MKRLNIVRGGNSRVVGAFYLPADRHASGLPCLLMVTGFPLDSGRLISDGYYDCAAEEFCRRGLAVLVVGPTSSLASDDELSLLAWAGQVRDALSYLEASACVHPRKIAAAGFSIGSVICTFVAAHDSRISALSVIGCPLYLDQPSPSEEEFVQVVRRVRMIGIRQARFFRRADQEAVADFRQMNPLSWISRLGDRPVLVLAGGRDLVVRPQDAEALFQAAKAPRRFELLEEVGHRFVEDGEVRRALLGWIEDIGLIGREATASQTACSPNVSRRRTREC